MKTNLTALLKISFFFLLTTHTLNSNAQNADSILKNNQIKLNAKFLGISASYEKRISSQFTFFSEVGIRTGNGLYVSSYDSSRGWKILNAELGVEGRYYYNLKKRFQNHKRTTHNSANFWSLSANYGPKPFAGASNTAQYEMVLDGQTFYVERFEKYSLLSIAPSWGFQRTVGNKFSIETSLGASIYYMDYGKQFHAYQNWEIGPAIGFRFGYVVK